jgi:hypothetical protein
MGPPLPAVWVILIAPGAIMLLAEHVAGLLPVASAGFGAGLGVAVLTVMSAGPLVACQRRTLAATGGIATTPPMIQATLGIAVRPVQMQQYIQCADANVAIATLICNICPDTNS